MNNARVLVFGTFDLFHPGHKYFLKQAKKFGDHLTVCVARDRTVKEIKHKSPHQNENVRRDNLIKSGLADLVVLGNLRKKYEVLKKIKPDIICLGYDQDSFIDQLPARLKLYGLCNTKITRLKSYKPSIYKTSKIVKRLIN